MLGKVIATHAPLLAAHRLHEGRIPGCTGLQTSNRARSRPCRAKQDDGELQLVRREETNDGAILFVFGDEAEAAAAQTAERSSVQEETTAPEPEAAYKEVREEAVKESAVATGAAESHEHATEVAATNGALLPGFEDDDKDVDEMLSDEDAPDLQDEIAKTLTSLRVIDLREMCKERKITGFSKMRKSALVRVLKDAMLADV